MALPQKHTVNAKVQVTGGAAKICALENAVKFCNQFGMVDADGPAGIISVAREFEKYLTEGDADAVSDSDDD